MISINLNTFAQAVILTITISAENMSAYMAYMYVSFGFIVRHTQAAPT